MLALTIDGYSLIALGIIAVVLVLLARIIARLMKDHGLRIARIGVFIERKRVTDFEPDTWTPDPLSPGRDQETRPVPLPPPTPPPPLPPDHGYPHREDE